MSKALLAAAVLTASAAALAWQSNLFPTLKSNAPPGKQAGGFYLLPTNQLLRPWGEQTLIPGRPVDLAFDASGRTLAVLNTRSVLLVDGVSGAQTGEIKTGTTSYTGVAFRPGTHELWASETTRKAGDLLIAEVTDDGKSGRVERMNLEGHPVPAGMAFAADGSRMYVAFSRNNTLAVIEPQTRKILQEVPVGVAPFGVAICEKCGRVFVTNRGGRRATASDTTAPSSGSAVVTDALTGSSVTGTVSVVDLKTLESKEIIVGLAPAGLSLSADGATLAVANAHSDSIAIIDTRSLKTVEVKIPAWPEGTLGSQPTATAFSPDGKRIYVACGGTNAVVVIGSEEDGWKMEGAVPTGWFPTAIAIDSAGALRIVNVKGVGSTANAKGTFNSRMFEGSLIKIPAPAPPQLAAGAREVEAANRPQFDSVGGVANLPSLGIQHVLFIVKENRAYDQVFGDMGKGNSDPKLTMYGRGITPNHHALAEQFVLLDNFYTGGSISFDGHQWLMQAFVSDYVERAFAASPRGYAWNMADALTVAPTGFFWQGAPRPLDVRIYGEFCLPAHWDPETRSVIDIHEEDMHTWSEYWKLYKEGGWQSQVGCKAGVPALANIMSPKQPNNSTAIPDQLRADSYLQDLAANEKTGKMPQITILTLNSDHTAGTRPGQPTPRAMVADNDLALGRVVEAVSKSRFWANTLILVVEDDAQDGVDHVDGRRTVALAIGPHIRHGIVDSNYYDHTSMVRTIQDIFGIPARTRFVKSARAMNSVFQPKPVMGTYRAITPEVALNEMNPGLHALSGKRLWAARQSLAMNFADIDDVPKDVLNRILWWDAKGYDVPFPVRKPGRGSIGNNAY
jgi:YVTN family beta-propeller protein